MAGRTKATSDADPMDVAVLPHDHRILLQVGDVVEGWLGTELEEQPADVRVEEALGDVVRILVVIDVLVMVAMLAATRAARSSQTRRRRRSA